MSENEFADFNDLFDPLVLPINGKKYTIPPMSFDAGVRINGLFGPDPETLPDEELFALLLGDTLSEMIADGVPAKAINRAGMAALSDFRENRAVAEAVWATGGDPKALTEYAKAQAPNRAARRSTRTAAATTTKPRASTSGTKTSRKK